MNLKSDPAAIGALFAQGLQLYRQGAMEQSESRLGVLLQLEPLHFDALHLQGLIAAQLGQPERAVKLIQAAIRQNATVAAAHRHLGNALRDLGRLEEALSSYGRAIQLRGDFKEAFVNRAMVLLMLRRAGQALADFDRAIELKADDAQVHTFRGSALIDLKRPAEAEASCARAISRQPNFTDAYVNRAAALHLLERYQEAIADSERAIALDGHQAAAHAQRGAALYALRRLWQALASLETAISLGPQSAFAHNLRALCLLDLQRPGEALESCDRAIALGPHFADAHNTRGLVLGDLEQFEAAKTSFERAIALEPDLAEPYFNKGVRLLQLGEFEPGWELYERRPMSHRVHPAGSRLWDGSQEVAGKVLLIYSEQGLGDTLQFCRYAKLLEARGARVILSVQESLCALLRSLGSGIQVTGWSDMPRYCDFHCPLLSLPRAFGTRPDGIPSSVPYLWPDLVRVAKWRERLGGEGRLIGIRWQGSTGRADAGRSFALRRFERLASLPTLRLISLQKGPGTEQLLEVRSAWPIEELGADFEPEGPDAFLDVAAVMQCLELVITSDTSIAHLAGALGRPTWLALKRVPDWRWMLHREDSPWYPTMKLFRQRRAGDWQGVFDRMYSEIETPPLDAARVP